MRKHKNSKKPVNTGWKRFVDATCLPPIRTDLSVSRTLRFSAAIADAQNTNASFSYQNLLDTQLIATSTTALVNLYDAVKIRRVTAHMFSNSSAGAATVGISAPSGNLGLNGDLRHVSDTSLGLAPAVVHWVPSKRSAQAQWQGNSANVAFQVSYENIAPGIGTTSTVILDVEVTFRNNDFAVPVAAANAGVGLTVGQWYYRGLDGLPAASTGWYPQGTTVIA